MMLNKVMKKSAVEMIYFSLVPYSGSTLKEQLDNCYNQLNQYLDEHELGKKNVVKQTLFISDSNLTSYLKNKKNLLDVSAGFFKCNIPTSVVPQPPLKDILVSIEFVVVPDSDKIDIHLKRNDRNDYIIIQTPKYIQVVASGLGSDKEISDIYTQSMEAFEQMHNILKAENMDFSNVIRQWNYIEKITELNGNNQHYQIFNDVRTAFYNNSQFIHGYPAATGIGMETGGIIIDFIAIKENMNMTILPVKSPVQSDAHQYTKKVLAHNEIKAGITAETTPKFERAKAIVSGNSCLIHVSGTSAIKGQFSLEANDASTQTNFTLESIYQLVTNENLQKQGINCIHSKANPCYFRVYVKNASDYLKVRDACEKYFKDVHAIYLKADICRPELLVEVEGVFTIDLEN
jgi:enamine deaminase RidA (YjgF/YER057c/UK114 family)